MFVTLKDGGQLIHLQSVLKVQLRPWEYFWKKKNICKQCYLRYDKSLVLILVPNCVYFSGWLLTGKDWIHNFITYLFSGWYPTSLSSFICDFCSNNSQVFPHQGMLMKEKNKTTKPNPIISGNRSMTGNVRTRSFCTFSMSDVKSNKLDDVLQSLSLPSCPFKVLSLFWWAVPPLSKHTNGTTQYLSHCVKSNWVSW